VPTVSAIEKSACIPTPLKPDGFNLKARLPYGCKVDAVKNGMQDFLKFLSIVNGGLNANALPRLEAMMMSANFSSMVGEFMAASIPKYCPTLVKNLYHNGHPDLIPARKFKDDAVQYAKEGIEIKGSRYLKAWQGHNPENVFLMVFVFASSRPSDVVKKVAPMPFRFVAVFGALLEKSDWLFAGRSEKSRRTITASVQPSGYAKMVANWIYRDEGALKLVEVADDDTTAEARELL
jgi:hypothetical protein